MNASTSFSDIRNGSENDDPNVAPSSLITEKMLDEESALEKKFASDEQSMRKKVLEQERQLQEENCYKRLKHLLSKSSLYVKFMGDKLAKHEAMMKKKNEQKVKQGSSEKVKERKRKAVESPVKKRQKTNVNILEVFKKENMQDIEEEEKESPTSYVNSSADIEDLEKQPKLLTGGVMRQYQLDGYEWMKSLYENGVNGILADEMGLGKTIQCIAFIAHLIEMGVSGPFLVCGPLSTVPNWYAEFKRFTPDIPVVLYHGDIQEREELRKKISKMTKVGNGRCYPVFITSYAIALNDRGKFRKVLWKMLVIDEAHRIKNFQCKLIEALKEYTGEHRLLLTGTPLQNNLSELWSLLNFILPEIFDDLKVFQSWFDISRLTQKGVKDEILAREQEKQIVSTIHQILAPFLLRRTKLDVKLNIPTKKEVLVECPLSPLQQQYYTAVLKNSIAKLIVPPVENKEALNLDGKRPKRSLKQTKHFGVHEEEVLDLSNLPKYVPQSADNNFNSAEIHLKLRNPLMCLRKICCHPYLISYPLDSYGEYLVDENIVRNSGKLRVLDVLLTELKKRGHKVLLFTQFVSMIEILQDFCHYRGHNYTCLMGDHNLSHRQEEIKKFNEDPDTFLFLISTRAGGLGINLVAADTVIVYDSDWNPQADLQAQDRCHRIGQTKPVVVYRLLIRNTVDEKVYNFAIAKRKLEKVIIQKGRFASKDLAAHQPQITREELLELLEMSEVNGLVKTDEETVLSKQELEKILDRSDMEHTS
ncbi:hypothetical protein JTE90_013078 [Oedothorax gibbosus]|uniref:Proliferation-associated SNF2-like protein n=1 Tax=Oedothorax gibbosus TaxID=931172 RepID=A0AAV6UMC0_9ARAC|nr:hypothetical protein JTE90_013078 [Oedothorax gibbosus]